MLFCGGERIWNGVFLHIMFYQPRFWVIRSHYIPMFYLYQMSSKKNVRCQKNGVLLLVFLGENLEFAILELSVKMKSHMSPSCNTIKTTPKRSPFPISAALFFDWVIESPQDLWISSLLWGQSDGPNGCGSKLMSKEAWNTRCDQVTCCHFGSLIFIDFATFKQYRYNFSCFFPAGLPKAIPQVPIPNTMTINIFQVVSPVCIKLLKQSQQSCDS